MRKILFALCFVSALLLSSCDNPDFARYEYYEKNLSYMIEGNVFVISEIEEEMANIAQNYCEGIILTKTEYDLDSELTGTSNYYYSKIDDDKSTVIILELDISEKIVTKLTYEKGHSKRVSASSISLENTNHNVNELYIEFTNDLNDRCIDITELAYMRISFVNNNIKAYCLNKAGKVTNGVNGIIEISQILR